MLSELSALRELEITVDTIDEPVADITECVKKLSPSLEKLRLRFENASEVLRMTTASAEGTTPATLHWNVAEVFPKLRQLKISEMEHIRDFEHSDQLLRSLPPSLEEFAWGSDTGHADYSLLPQGLTSLGLNTSNSGWLEPAQSAALPRSLKILLLIGASSLEVVREFPPTLEKAMISSDLAGTSDCLAALPAPFQELTIRPGSSFDEWPLALPKRLTKLTCHDFILLPDHVALLPRSITSLKQIVIDFEAFIKVLDNEGSAAVHALWPSALTSLTFGRDEEHGYFRQFPATKLAIFPPTLTALRRLYVSGEALILDHVADLPASLTDLWVHQANIAKQSITSPLPTRWKKLRLDRVIIAPEHFAMLPPNLVSLLLSHTPLEKDGCAVAVAHIPRSVAKLDLCRLDEKGFSALPPSLTRLGLGHQVYPSQFESFPSYLSFKESDDISFLCEPIESYQWFQM